MFCSQKEALHEGELLEDLFDEEHDILARPDLLRYLTRGLSKRGHLLYASSFCLPSRRARFLGLRTLPGPVLLLWL